MNLTGGIILFAVYWFVIFLAVLPIGMTSQGDSGHVVPGTPSSAPADARIVRKAWITTAITCVLWAITAGIVFSGAISIRDLDVFHRMEPVQAR